MSWSHLTWPIRLPDMDQFHERFGCETLTSHLNLLACLAGEHVESRDGTDRGHLGCYPRIDGWV